MSYSYDDKCEELARHFLADEMPFAADVKDLAQHIQDAIEDWLAEHPDYGARSEGGG